MVYTTTIRSKRQRIVTALESLRARHPEKTVAVVTHGGVLDPGNPPVLQPPIPPFGLTGTMSNALLVAGAHTRTGKPIAVFGPQTSYYMPQLLVEKDVHGPNIDARGVAFAGTDLFVQLGRGRNYAWSATSAGGDNVDQWVLELCEPGGGTPTVNSMGYMRNGTCEPIDAYTHMQIAKPSMAPRNIPRNPPRHVPASRTDSVLLINLRQ